MTTPPKYDHMVFGHNAIYKASGFTAREIKLPRIAVINSWSEQSPGHIVLRAVADGVKAGIRMAGGMPIEIGVPGLCSVPCRGAHDMLYDMPQREAVLAGAESTLNITWCDGWVGLGTCDKIIPGLILAALRLNRPFIFIGGGQQMPSDYEGKRFGFVRGTGVLSEKIRDAKKPLSAAAIEELAQELSSCCATSAGACNELTTGNTMALLAEGLGLALPGSSTSPGVSAEKIWQAKETGEAIMELVKRNIRPRDIVTLASMKNAIAVDMATCGGTNSVAHMQAYAHEAQIPLTLKDWDEVSRKVPALCNVAPTGPYVLYDYHKVGGTPAVMKRIEKFLDKSCMTVTGKTVGENLKKVKCEDIDVIRPLNDPIWPEGATAVLTGNLAPRGAVVRHTVVENKALLKRVYTARVFDTVTEISEGAIKGKIGPGDAVVLRYQGPRGGPAFTECLGALSPLRMNKIKDVIIITDGRFSGFTQGYLSIGHVCPEAQVGGPLALVKDGDRINLDIPARKLELQVTAAELKKRKAHWQAPTQSDVTGMLTIYAKLALQADEGAGWPARMADFD
ncbi:MAG: dihydroxy-acid dehydratase [Dehalococcoidales bacterium]|jgi:dihydroxy-acid dehydratase